jgi:poly(A) polymerase
VSAARAGAGADPGPGPGGGSALTAAQRRAVSELVRVAPLAGELGRRFAAAGHDLALVGGSVRDALLGRLGRDLDFTTDAPPHRVLELVRPWADAVWDIGIAFGTVGARKDAYVVEITTYRADRYDRNSRKPDVTYGTSLEADLARRDFTLNAMAVRLPSGDFVDPHDGLRDLTERRLRTPGRAQDSFDDDPLRMLRAARFAAQLDLTVAPEVLAAMTEMSGRLEIVSAERIRDELVKLVCAPAPRIGLTLLVDTGLADVVLPELPKLRLEVDEHHRHKDVYEHTLTVLEQAIALEDDSCDPILRFAALLHDIGKPRTRRFEAGGRVSFHHHEVVGAQLARSRLRALRFPKDEVEAIARLVELHLRFHGYTGGWTDSAVRRYVRAAGPLLDRLHKLTRSDSTTRNRRKAAMLQQAYAHLERRIAELAAAEELAALRPDLDGSQIMEILGLPPGPLVGRARAHLLELRLDRGPLEHEDAVAELKQWYAAQPEAADPPAPPGRTPARSPRSRPR